MVKKVRCDNASNLTSNDMMQFYSRYGIKLETLANYHPKDNQLSKGTIHCCKRDLEAKATPMPSTTLLHWTWPPGKDKHCPHSIPCTSWHPHDPRQRKIPGGEEHSGGQVEGTPTRTQHQVGEPPSQCSLWRNICTAPNEFKLILLNHSSPSKILCLY